MITATVENGRITAVETDDPAMRAWIDGIIHRDVPMYVPLADAIVADAIISEIEGCKTYFTLMKTAWRVRQRIWALPQPLQDLLCKVIGDGMKRLDGRCASGAPG